MRELLHRALRRSWWVGAWAILMWCPGCTKPQTVKTTKATTAKKPRKAVLQGPPKRGALVRINSRRYSLATRGLLPPSGHPPRGKLPLKQAKAALKPGMRALRSCARRSRHMFPTGIPMLRFRILVGPEGRVWRSELDEPFASLPRSARCLRGVLHRLRFPAPQGDRFAIWLHDLSLR